MFGLTMIAEASGAPLAGIDLAIAVGQVAW